MGKGRGAHRGGVQVKGDTCRGRAPGVGRVDSHCCPVGHWTGDTKEANSSHFVTIQESRRASEIDQSET